MSVQEARKKILDRIREARIHSDTRLKVKPEKPDVVQDEYLSELDDLPELVFAKNLVLVNGKFSYCANSQDLIESISQLFKEEGWSKAFCSENDLQPLLDRAEIPHFHDPNKIPQIEVAFTSCEYLIARTGSVMVSTGQGSGRRLFGYTPVHIVVGRTSQLVNELSDALSAMKGKYDDLPSQITLITGPSRTADIEKTLVLGAHGPREFYVFLINDL